MDAAGRWQILRLHVEDQIPLAALARDTGVGLRTLERWHARYRTEGYTASVREDALMPAAITCPPSSCP